MDLLVALHEARGSGVCGEVFEISEGQFSSLKICKVVKSLEVLGWKLDSISMDFVSG